MMMIRLTLDRPSYDLDYRSSAVLTKAGILNFAKVIGCLSPAVCRATRSKIYYYLAMFSLSSTECLNEHLRVGAPQSANLVAGTVWSTKW